MGVSEAWLSNLANQGFAEFGPEHSAHFNGFVDAVDLERIARIAHCRKAPPSRPRRRKSEDAVVVGLHDLGGVVGIARLIKVAFIEKFDLHRCVGRGFAVNEHAALKPKLPGTSS